MARTFRLILVAALAACGGKTSNNLPDAATGAHVVLSAATVDFGKANCGGTAPGDQAIALMNTGSEALTYSTSLAGTAFSVKSGGSGSVAPGDSATIMLSAAPIAGGVDSGTAVSASLKITTNDSTQSTINVPISVTASGAQISLDLPTVSFGDQPISQASNPVAVSFKNTGDQAVGVTIAQPGDSQYGIAYTGFPSSVTLNAGDSVPALEFTFTPDTTNPSSTTAAVSLGGTVCGTPPSDITLMGKGTVGQFANTGDLDFGDTPCGATAAAQDVTINNSGDADFKITSLALGKGAASPFVASAASSTVPANGSTTVTIAPNPAPTSVASLPADLGDTLVIMTDIPGDDQHVIHLKQGAQGAILAFDTTAIPFDKVPVTSSQSQGFKVRNKGNLVAHVTLSTDNGVFTVNPSAAEDVTDVLNATATFSPTDTTPQSANLSAAVASGDVLCQPLPTPIALSGTGQNGGVAFDTLTLDYGQVNCGGTAGPQTFTMTNKGNAGLTWNASLNRSPSSFTIACPSGGSSCTGTGALNGSLAPGDSVTITVTPSAIPATTPTTDDLFGDQVTINTNVLGDTSHTIDLQMTARGAILAFASQSVDVGNVPKNQSGSTVFGIVNSGDLDADVDLASDNGLFTVPTPVSVSANSTPQFPVMFSPTDVGDQQANITLSSTVVLCAPLPTDPMVATGSGTASAVGVSPASIDFDSGAVGVYCGSQATPSSVTITNGTAADFDYTAALLDGTNYVISPSSGTVAKNGGTATITVTPNAIPQTSAVPGAYGDTLEITTDVLDDTPHDVSLVENARGAIITRASDSITFADAPVDGQSIGQLAITNSGNDPAGITWGTPTNSVFVMKGVAVPASSTKQDSNLFRPTNAQPYNGTVTMGVSASTVLCQPLPAADVSLAGTGVNQPLIFSSTNSLDFGNTGCGATSAVGSLAFTVTNNTTGSVNFTSNALSHYGLDVPSGSIAANGTQTFNVTPNAIPQSFDPTTTLPDFGQTLTLTFDDSNNTKVVILISQSIFGAMLYWVPSSATIPGGLFTASATSKLTNNGNRSVAVTLVSSDTKDFTLGTSSGTVSQGSTLSVSVSRPGLSGGHSTNVTVSGLTGSPPPLCNATSVGGLGAFTVSD